MTVTPSGRDWVELHAQQMRHAATQAVNASNLWNRLNDEFTDFARRSRWDALAIARHKPANLGLSDAYGAYQFWQSKVLMHAAVLQGEAAAQALLTGGDPTGLRYDRDDEPPAPSTRPHTGWSVSGRAARTSDSPAGPPVDVPVAGRPPTQGRPGPQPSGARVRRASDTGPGGTVAGASVPPALRGERGIW